MSVILRNARVVLSTSTEEGLHDVSESTTKVLLARDWESIDTTCVLDTVQRSIAGREEWAFSIDMLQAFSTDRAESGIRIDTLLASLAERTNQNRPFLVQVLTDRDKPRLQDNPEYSGLCLLDGYSPLDGAVGELLKVQPEFIGVSDLERNTGRPDSAHPLDTIVVQLTEGLRTITTEDFLTEDEPIILQEVLTILDIGGTVSKTATDALVIQVSAENSPLIESGGVVLRTTVDTLEVIGSEGALAQVQTGTIPITTSDTLEVHLVQDGQTITKLTTDTCAVACTEAASIAFAVVVSDTLLIGETEAPKIAATMTETETFRVVASESILRLQYATPAFIQQAQQSGAGASNIVVLSTNVTAGSLLTVCVAFDGTRTISGVADTQGNTWQQAVTILSADLTTRLSIWYAMNANAGATTVTVTYSAATSFASAGVMEHSGISLTSALDATSSLQQHDPGLGSNAITSGTAATVAQTTLVIGAVTAFSGVASTVVAGSGYTCRIGLFGFTCGTCPDAVEDRVLTSQQTIASTWTQSGGSPAADYLSAMAVFKAKLV